VIHLDTSYLVDLLRETARGKPGPATKRLDEISHEDLWLSVHAACELHAGAEGSDRPAVERERVAVLCSGMHLALPAAGFAETFGRLYASLAKRGAAIATMDLLIATAAVQARAPLLTRNVREFSRVPGLEVVTY
jgi:predicted nucleic acid-binding protein